MFKYLKHTLLKEFEKGGESMRLGFTFDLPTQSFPLAHRLGVLSIIKEAVRQSSEDYYSEIFVRNKREIKPFVFSTYFHNLKIEEDEIHATKLQLTVSSHNHAFLLHLYNGSQMNKQFQYRKYTANLIHVHVLPDKTIRDEEVTFQLASPLLIENKLGKPVEPGTPEYEQELNYISNLAIQAYHERSLHRPIRIKQHALRKQVVKENFHQDNHQPLYFTTYKGNITLEGHPEDLQSLYDCGIGWRTNLGFGLAQIT